jgi:hypothetical protein
LTSAYDNTDNFKVVYAFPKQKARQEATKAVNLPELKVTNITPNASNYPAKGKPQS